MLVDMAQCDDLFHTAAGTAFADILVNGHRETWPIRSKRFRGWLRRRYYEETGEAACAAAIRSALDLLETRAQFDGPERAVHIRLAEHAGHIYLDLADENWRAVNIGPDGWRVIGCPPVRFRRSPGMLPLPVPQQGGSIETLRSFLNVASRKDFVLIVTWLLATLRSGGPYPLLAISGEQGSAKTVLSKLLKALIDPNAALVRVLSRERTSRFSVVRSLNPHSSRPGVAERVSPSVGNAHAAPGVAHLLIVQHRRPRCEARESAATSCRPPLGQNRRRPPDRAAPTRRRDK
jgi:hypothetical protein